MDKNKFFDDFFKFLSLLFWPIVWFKWQFLSDYFTSFLLFTIYLTLSIIYILLFVYYKCKYKNINKIVFLYRISTLLAFVFTLLSFLLFPKNLFLLSLKIIFVLIYLYISTIKVCKYHMDEGVVGILGALLLIVITILY